LRLLGSLQARTLALLWATDWRPPLLARLFIVFHCEQRNNARMAEHVYKKIEIVGSSPNGMEDAVHNGLSRASKTIRNMRWFEVTETRGYIDEGKIEHWQVTLKIGFTLEE
jgi:flavin-binding protein dodecin